MSHDMIGLLCSYAYIGAVVAVGETASRLGLSRDVARKIIHVGVGLWVFGTLALFDSRYIAVIPPLTAAVANWVIHRKQLLRAVAAEPENLGTVWFPISFAALILLAWDRPEAVAGGILAMTIGDALAAAVGQRWGRHGYESLGGARKSLEGSLAMLGGTFATVAAVLAWSGWAAYVGAATLAAVVAMCAEALGAKGRDNLWVPLAVGAVLYFAVSGVTLDTLALGALLAAAIGMLAWLKGSLSPGGVLGAIITGTLVFGLGGWPGGVALVGFFLSASLLSKLYQSRKATVEAEYAKGGTRDLAQALANGGLAAAAAAVLGLTGDPRWLGALLGALAAANADTWATELGVLSRSAPRLITTFRPSEPGTSGAISAAGTLAALGGGAFVGLVAALAAPDLWPFLPRLALAGLAGALADSLLGATVQASYWCPDCRKTTERRRHRCGTETVLRRGLPWLDNDLVNLLATAVGGLIGFLAT